MTDIDWIEVVTLDCGHTVEKGKVAYKEDHGERWSMCYDCAYIETMDDIVMVGVLDRKDLRLPTVYMSGDGKTVTTWDGQFIGHVTRIGQRHALASKWKNSKMERRYIDVRINYGADVVNAYGTGAPGEYCSLRRRKSDLRAR